VLSFKKNICYNFKNELTEDNYFEFAGGVTLENAVAHIKDKASCKPDKTGRAAGREYALKHFSNYSEHFLNRLYGPIADIPQPRTYLAQHVYAKCDDGFCNQLRMLLAGEYLVQKNYLQSYTQEWAVSNHNNVNFLDFFEPPKFAQLENIPQNKITRVDGDFCGMTGRYAAQNANQWSSNLRETFKTLKLRPDIQQTVDEYLQKIDCANVVGIHARRTCKLSANRAFSRATRHLTNEELLAELTDNDLKVYVATDNRETQEYFKQHLKERCIVYSDILYGAENHCSVEYIREDVTRFTEALHTIIDFYSLLSCKRFIGTESSSFTALIYHLRGVEDDYRIITSV
jgi:hypothetical protein